MLTDKIEGGTQNIKSTILGYLLYFFYSKYYFVLGPTKIVQQIFKMNPLQQIDVLGQTTVKNWTK